MKPGTPGFEGARLREAREARGFTAVSLAELVEASAQSVSRWEHGENSPSPETLQAVAEKLNLPLAYFTYPARPVLESAVFYRSMSAATKRARTRALRKLGWLQEIGAYLREYVDFPAINLPDLRLPDDPLMISDDDIENAADDVRRFWRMGNSPVANMVSLVENQGAIVARHQLDAESLDGLSAVGHDDRRPYIIVGTDKGTAVRWRFDVAHELGHLLLHRQVGQTALARSPLFKRIEEQAHRFAAAFLLPMDSFSEDLFAISLDAMRAMKPKWKVSVSMMIIRARHAGLVTEESERRLWINLSRRGWRREEPYDIDMPAEQPRLLGRAVELVLDSGAVTPDDLVSNLRLALSDIEGLSGLPAGFLCRDFTPVRMIQPRTHTDVDPNRPPGEVVPLPTRRRDA